MESRHDNYGLVQCLIVCHEINKTENEACNRAFGNGFSADVMTHVSERKFFYCSVDTQFAIFTMRMEI